MSKKKAVRQGGSLYLTSPLEQRTTVLTTGMVEGESREPVTWTFSRADGGRSFYSSMGHVDDFVNAEFTALLYNGICWAAGITPSVSPAHDHWSIVDVPTSSDSDLPSDTADVWYRCAVRLPADWLGTKTILKLTLNSGGDEVDAWFNGHRSFARKVSDGKKVELVLRT